MASAEDDTTFGILDFRLDQIKRKTSFSINALFEETNINFYKSITLFLIKVNGVLKFFCANAMQKLLYLRATVDFFSVKLYKGSTPFRRGSRHAAHAAKSIAMGKRFYTKMPYKKITLLS